MEKHIYTYIQIIIFHFYFSAHIWFKYIIYLMTNSVKWEVQKIFHLITDFTYQQNSQKIFLIDSALQSLKKGLVGKLNPIGLIGPEKELTNYFRKQEIKLENRQNEQKIMLVLDRNKEKAALFIVYQSTPFSNENEKKNIYVCFRANDDFYYGKESSKGSIYYLLLRFMQDLCQRIIILYDEYLQQNFDASKCPFFNSGNFSQITLQERKLSDIKVRQLKLEQQFLKKWIEVTEKSKIVDISIPRNKILVKRPFLKQDYLNQLKIKVNKIKSFLWNKIMYQQTNQQKKKILKQIQMEQKRQNIKILEKIFQFRKNFKDQVSKFSKQIYKNFITLVGGNLPRPFPNQLLEDIYNSIQRNLQIKPETNQHFNEKQKQMSWYFTINLYNKVKSSKNIHQLKQYYIKGQQNLQKSWKQFNLIIGNLVKSFCEICEEYLNTSLIIKEQAYELEQIQLMQNNQKVLIKQIESFKLIQSKLNKKIGQMKFFENILHMELFDLKNLNLKLLFISVSVPKQSEAYRSLYLFIWNKAKDQFQIIFKFLNKKNLFFLFNERYQKGYFFHQDEKTFTTFEIDNYAGVKKLKKREYKKCTPEIVDFGVTLQPFEILFYLDSNRKVLHAIQVRQKEIIESGYDRSSCQEKYLTQPGQKEYQFIKTFDSNILVALGNKDIIHIFSLRKGQGKLDLFHKIDLLTSELKITMVNKQTSSYLMISNSKSIKFICFQNINAQIVFKKISETEQIAGNPILDLFYLSKEKFGRDKFLSDLQINQLSTFKNIVMSHSFQTPNFQQKIANYIKIIQLQQIQQYEDKQSSSSFNNIFINATHFINTISLRIPIQICTLENQNIIPLSVQNYFKQKSQSLTISQRSKILDFGIVQKLLQKKLKKTIVIGIIGAQSTGKSYLMNRLFGTRFTVSSSRCTVGIWLSVVQNEQNFYLLLDCEGLFGYRRNQNEQEKLIRLITTCCDIVILNQNMGLNNRNLLQLLDGIYQNSNEHREGNKGKLLLVVRDVKSSQSNGIKNQFYSNISNYILQKKSYLKLFSNQISLITIENYEKQRQFKAGIIQIRDFIKKEAKNRFNTCKTSKQCLQDIKIIVSQLSCDDPKKFKEEKLKFKLQIFQESIRSCWLKGSESSSSMKIRENNFLIIQNEVQMDIEQMNKQKAGCLQVIQKKFKDQIIGDKPLNAEEHNKTYSQFEKFLQLFFQQRYKQVCNEIDKRQKQINEVCETLDPTYKQQIQNIIQNIKNLIQNHKKKLRLCRQRCSQCFLGCVYRTNHSLDLNKQIQKRKNKDQMFKKQLQQIQKAVQNEDNIQRIQNGLIQDRKKNQFCIQISKIFNNIQQKKNVRQIAKADMKFYQENKKHSSNALSSQNSNQLINIIDQFKQLFKEGASISQQCQMNLNEGKQMLNQYKQNCKEISKRIDRQFLQKISLKFKYIQQQYGKIVTQGLRMKQKIAEKVSDLEKQKKNFFNELVKYQNQIEILASSVSQKQRNIQIQKENIEKYEAYLSRLKKQLQQNIETQRYFEQWDRACKACKIQEPEIDQIVDKVCELIQRSQDIEIYQKHEIVYSNDQILQFKRILVENKSSDKIESTQQMKKKLEKRISTQESKLKYLRNHEDRIKNNQLIQKLKIQLSTLEKIKAQQFYQEQQLKRCNHDKKRRIQVVDQLSKYGNLTDFVNQITDEGNTQKYNMGRIKMDTEKFLLDSEKYVVENLQNIFTQKQVQDIFKCKLGVLEQSLAKSLERQRDDIEKLNNQELMLTQNQQEELIKKLDENSREIDWLERISKAKQHLILCFKKLFEKVEEDFNLQLKSKLKLLDDSFLQNFNMMEKEVRKVQKGKLNLKEALKSFLESNLKKTQTKVKQKLKQLMSQQIVQTQLNSSELLSNTRKQNSFKVNKVSEINDKIRNLQSNLKIMMKQAQEKQKLLQTLEGDRQKLKINIQNHKSLIESQVRKITEDRLLNNMQRIQFNDCNDALQKWKNQFNFNQEATTKIMQMESLINLTRSKINNLDLQIQELSNKVKDFDEEKVTNQIQNTKERIKQRQKLLDNIEKKKDIQINLYENELQLQKMIQSSSLKCNCQTIHKCMLKCQAQSCKQTLSKCNNLAGHSGPHLCKEIQHKCNFKCSIDENCKNYCTQKLNHSQFTPHNCHNSHQCKQKCNYCDNTCNSSIYVDHKIHMCNKSKKCSYNCLLCSNKCSHMQHGHDQFAQIIEFERFDEQKREYRKEKKKLHLCQNQHNCHKLCQQKGVCNIEYTDTEKKMITETGQIKLYSYIQQTQKREKCKIKIIKGKFYHEGECNCKKTHTCQSRCPDCNSLCKNENFHSNQHKAQHRNQDQLIYVATDINNKILAEGVKFEVGQKSIVSRCGNSCKEKGRGHYHLVQCESQQKCLTNNKQIKSKHSPLIYYPYTKKKYDLLPCEQYWKFHNFIQPYTQEDFKKCTMCCPFQHKNRSATFYCSDNLWHTQSKNWIEHKFECKKEHQPVKQLQICFLIDITGSMGRFLDQCKLTIKQIIQNANSSKVQVLFSIVGYRDHEMYKSNIFKSLESLCDSKLKELMETSGLQWINQIRDITQIKKMISNAFSKYEIMKNKDNIQFTQQQQFLLKYSYPFLLNIKSSESKIYLKVQRKTISILQYLSLSINQAAKSLKEEKQSEIKNNYNLLSSSKLSDGKEILNFLEKIKCIGGGDAPQAVLDGMDQLTKVGWTLSTQKKRYIIHLLDAPPHGMQYTLLADRYPEGCPCNLKIEEIISKISKIINMKYIIYPLTDNLDKTMQQFKRLGLNFTRKNILKDKPEQFRIDVTQVICSSFQQSQIHAKKN